MLMYFRKWWLARVLQRMQLATELGIDLLHHAHLLAVPRYMYLAVITCPQDR